MPIGICILPSIKAIMGMTTAPSGLLVCHSPKWQCSISTLTAMLYLALKVYLFSCVLTKLANLLILLRKIREKKRKDSKCCVKAERHLQNKRLGPRFLESLKEIDKMEEMVPSPYLYRNKR